MRVRTYDILNAGPRNRFSANGRIVSNSARGAQIQNLPRGTEKDVDGAIAAILSGDATLVDMLYGSPPSVVSSCLRGMIAAPPGHVMYCSDFSAIEAKATSYMSSQESVLEVFRSGQDIYCHAASAVFNKPINKKDHSVERQIGKVEVLALGFAGGVGAFAAMAAMYGLDLDSCYEPVWASATQKNRDAAVKAYEERGKSSGAGLSEKAWIACEIIKLAWRQDNSNTVEWWGDCQGAAHDAVKNPGQVFEVSKGVRYKKSGSWLFAQLPSGRTIAYPYARIKMQARAEFIHPDGSESSRPFRGETESEIERQAHQFLAAANAKNPQYAAPILLKKIGRASEVIRYKGVDGRTRKWSDQYLWKGTIVENLVQGFARDLMAEAMLRLDKAGYIICGTVHDEIMAYAPIGFGSLEEFISIMEEVPSWAAGCPITASGWVSDRYKKD